MRNRLVSSSFSMLVLLGTVSMGAILTSQQSWAQEKTPEVAIEAEGDAGGETDTIDASQVPTFTGAYLSGQIADSDNEIEQAIAFYKRALEFDSENLTAKRRLFSSLLFSGDFDGAVEIADTLKDDADVAERVDQALAVQTIRKREYHSTDRYLDYTSNNLVDQLLNQILSAWSKFGDNKIDEALKQINDQQGPNWYKHFKDFNTGMMAAASGNNELAIKHFNDMIADEQATRVTPDAYLQAIMALAILHAQAGDKNLALAALDSNPNVKRIFPPVDALEKLILADAELKFPVKNAQQGASAALYAIAGAINQSGNEETSGFYLQFSRALDSKNAAALVMLAGLQEQLGKPEKAIEIYRSVPEKSQMRRLSELRLGVNLANIDKNDEALEHIAALIATYPKDIRAYEVYGNILSRDKRYQDVADNFNAAVKTLGPIHDRSHWNLFYQLGIANERLKDWDKAEAAFKRSLELFPNQPDVMNYLGYSWVDMNINLKEGMDLIRAAVDLRPDSGYIVDSLGWAYYRQGQYEDAVRELERAVELRPVDATINDHLGDGYWKVGRKIEARFQWERALTNMGDFDKSLIPIIEKKLKEGLPDNNTGSSSASNDG